MLKRPARLIGCAAAVVSALLLFGAGEPVGFGPLAFVALIPLLVAVLREPKPVWSWLYGFVFGTAFFGVHLSWIFIFGWMAWTALTAVLALYLSVATLVAGFVRKLPIAPLLVAGAWGGVEVVRDRWPFGGYPWGTIGTTQASVPGVRFLAGVVGVYGLTLLVVFVNAFVADRLVHGRFSWTSLAVVASVLAVFTAIDRVAYSEAPKGRIERLLVVQGGVPRPPTADQRDRIFDSHVRLTREAFAVRAARHEPLPGIVLWPEDSMGVGVRDSAQAELMALARELDTPFVAGRSVLAGTPGLANPHGGKLREDSPVGGFRNTVEHVTARGVLDGVYVKRHPVPFGEYVPIRFFRRFVSTLQEEIPYDLRRGGEATVFDVEGAKIATPICFESVFPRDIHDFTRNGAELYVVSTNNASFEHSYAAQQHLAHGRMRALETRQWVVQDALAGISAVLTPDGKVEHPTRLFTSEAFVTTVHLRKAHSLYASVGDVFPEGFAILTLAYALWKRREILGGMERSDSSKW